MDIKSALGFGPQGYIKIFKGRVQEHDAWFRSINARYSKYWGWYLPEERDIYVLPFGVEIALLKWEDVSVGDALKPDKEIQSVVAQLIYAADDSQYLGTPGAELEVIATLRKAVPVETNYGSKILYSFDDAKGNHILWTTTEGLTIGATYKLLGTVAQHKLYKNCKQTVIKKVRFSIHEN